MKSRFGGYFLLDFEICQHDVFKNSNHSKDIGGPTQNGQQFMAFNSIGERKAVTVKKAMVVTNLIFFALEAGKSLST